MLIISLFLVLIAAGINVAIKAKDMYGRLLATGIISVVSNTAYNKRCCCNR